MVPMRNDTMFKSRWMALLWGAGIVLLALKAATSAEADRITNDLTGATISDEDAKKFARVDKR